MKMTVYLTLGAMLSLIGLIALYVKSGAATFDLIALKAHLAAQPLPVTLQSNGISPGHTGKSVRSFWEISQSRR